MFLSGIKCCRNKATAIIKEMSAKIVNDLAKRMQLQPYSISTDGSNDADKKYFPLVVTIEGGDGLVNPELLALPVCQGSATGTNILFWFSFWFEIASIKFTKLNKNCSAVIHNDFQ